MKSRKFYFFRLTISRISCWSDDPDGKMEVLIDEITSLLDTLGSLSEAGMEVLSNHVEFPTSSIEQALQRMMEISEEKRLE